MYSHDEQHLDSLPAEFKFRNEFRAFRNNFINECGDGSCADGSCDNSGKTGNDWFEEYEALGGKDDQYTLWHDALPVNGLQDLNYPFDGDDELWKAEMNDTEIPVWFNETSYDEFVKMFGTPEQAVQDEQQTGLEDDSYVDPETNLENESCCCGGKKKNKKSKWFAFKSKKSDKGKNKVEEALETLKRLGYEAVLNEATNEITLIVNTYIKHETTKTADNRTPEGRRTYHMNAKAYGLEDYRPKKGEEAPKETAETRKEMLQRAMKKRAEANALGKDAQQMGSTTVGMIHRKADFDSSKSWTWVDTAAIKDFFANYGLTVSEQHTQATVSQDVDEEPVADWGHNGPYGENSNYITYFTTYSERTWALKIIGTPENWVKFCNAEMDYDLTEEDMDGNTYNLTYPENKEYFEQFITQYIPNYKTGKGYVINVTLKQD